MRPLEQGTFPNSWIHGGDCVKDPLIQVLPFRDGTTHFVFDPLPSGRKHQSSVLPPSCRRHACIS